MNPEGPSSRGGLTSSVLLGLLLSASIIWVAGGDIGNLPREERNNAWLSFVVSWLVGGAIGFLIVRSTQQSPARKPSSHYVGMWARVLLPIAGLALLFEQLAPIVVKVPVLGFFGGTGVSLVLTSWLVLTHPRTKGDDSNPT